MYVLKWTRAALFKIALPHVISAGYASLVQEYTMLFLLVGEN
jgi:hypothetical protein